MGNLEMLVGACCGWMTIGDGIDKRNSGCQAYCDRYWQCDPVHAGQCQRPKYDAEREQVRVNFC